MSWFVMTFLIRIGLCEVGKYCGEDEDLNRSIFVRADVEDLDMSLLYVLRMM